MAIKHAFTSAKSDGGDATVVRPSNWNADHVLNAASFGRAHTNGTTAYTTNSTSWSEIDSTNLKTTMTTSGGRVLVSFGAIVVAATNDGPAIDVEIDGTRYGAESTFGIAYVYNWASSQYLGFTFITETAPSAGSHTFAVVWRSINGATVSANIKTDQCIGIFSVMELPT